MPSSNTKFVNVMTVYPQRCILTGYPNSQNMEPALDLGFAIPDYGHVYVSALGMGWLARQTNYISEKESDERVNEVHEDLRAARARIKELEEALSHVPQTIEGVINGIKQLSVNAIVDLAGIDGHSEPNPGIVDSEDRTESDSSDSKPPVKATGRSSKASSK